MIPYKFFSLNVRDQTGVLLSNIHRKLEKTQNSNNVGHVIFTVPSENGFLLSSYSIEANGAIGVAYGDRAELNILDAQGNTLSSLITNLQSGIGAVGAAFPFTINSAITHTGSPIAVIGPGLQIELRVRFSAANAANNIDTSINGVLIPHGTMAYQQ